MSKHILRLSLLLISVLLCVVWLTPGGPSDAQTTTCENAPDIYHSICVDVSVTLSIQKDANGKPDTDYTGYDFWLTKMNQFNGNLHQRGDG